METFSVSLALCAGNSPVTGEFPSQRPLTQSFDVFFDLRLNKHLSKQWKHQWFEMPSQSLWRHCNVKGYNNFQIRKWLWKWPFCLILSVLRCNACKPLDVDNDKLSVWPTDCDSGNALLMKGTTTVTANKGLLDNRNFLEKSWFSKL